MKSLLLLIIFLGVIPVLQAQLTGTNLGLYTNKYTTNASYYQELREIEKSTADRAINARIKEYIQAPQKNLKAQETANKLAQLELEEQIAKRKMETLERDQVRENLKSQLLYKFMKSLLVTNTNISKSGSSNASKADVPIQTATPAPLIPSDQEALKAEPPQ